MRAKTIERAKDRSIGGELGRGGLACGPAAAVVAVKIQNRARDAARDPARSLLTRAGSRFAWCETMDGTNWLIAA
jgi:hypothetical protein